MGIVDEDIERLRSTVSIVDTVQQYVALKRVGRNWVGLCPFHAEKTPSFTVYPDSSHYKCYGCGKAGDVYSFLMERDGISFRRGSLHAALAHGCPIVSTNPSVLLPELVEGENILLVPPDDPQAICQAVRRLHDDPELARRLAEMAESSPVEVALSDEDRAHLRALGYLH